MPDEIAFGGLVSSCVTSVTSVSSVSVEYQYHYIYIYIEIDYI